MGDRPNSSVPKLYEMFQDSFDIGAAVNPRTIVQAGELIANQYNSLTAENEIIEVSVFRSDDTRVVLTAPSFWRVVEQ
jgi:endo-1,4-beta-xylanase